jgi:hypothetical protein
MSEDSSPAGGANPAEVSDLRVVSRTLPPTPVLSQPKTGPSSSADAVEALVLDAKSSTPDASGDAEAPSAESDADNSDQGIEQTDEQKTKKRNRNSAQERISELTARLRAAEAAARSAERRYRELSKPVQTSGKPEDLTFDEAEAKRLREAIRAERRDEIEQEGRLRHAEALASRNAVFTAKVEAVADRMPDLWQRFDQVPVSEFAADFIADSEKTVEIAHFLASNPKEAHRIARLPEARQGIELARIEGRLEKAPAARKVSSAPPPHTKIAGAAANTGTKTPEEMSYTEYVQWMEKRGF